MHIKNARATLLLGAAALLAASTTFAAAVTKLSTDALAPLHAPLGTKRIRIDKLQLFGSTPAVMDLEEFQVWAPGAKVIVHRANDVVEYQDPPPMRFFRGLVNGDPDSFAYFSVDGRTGRVEGFINVHQQKWEIQGQRRPGSVLRPRSGGLNESDFDEFLTAYEAEDEVPSQPWQCDVDKLKINPAQMPRAIRATGADGLPIESQTISGTQTYTISVVVETDYDLYVLAGSSTSNLTNYVTNLSGTVSTIYNRDLHTNLLQQSIDIWTSTGGSYPWTATTAATGLNQLGDYYHAHFPTLQRSAVVLLSGKNTNSGIAWQSVVCGPDFANGADWGGAYAWCGSIAYNGASIPDPNGTVDSHVYGMPGNTYWPLLEYSHELGHVLAGHHTHCIALTPAEVTATGRSYVDICYNAESGCYAGATTAVPAEWGTIMSYCHLFFDGSGNPESRYTFGQASEVSHHQQDDYMLHAGGPIDGFVNIVSQTSSLSLSAITAPSTVSPSSTGNSASISSIAGATYSWTIQNGTITAGATTTNVTFTAGASGSVILGITAWASNGCGVSDSKSVTIGSPYNPPTNVVATATGTTTVSITWIAATGTPPGRYDVYRSADHLTYAPAGNTTGTTFNDTGASAGAAYLYKVKSAASDGTNESADSNVDLATTVIYTPTISTGSIIMAVDMTQMRAAVTALRVLSGQPTTNFTNAITAGVTVVHAVDITELRTYINNARSAIGLTTLTFANPGLTTGSTISAVDFNELRAGMQ